MNPDPPRLPPHSRAAQEMVAVIAAEARATGSCTGRARLSARVLDVLASLPRHKFLAPADARLAYINAAVHIGHGQTISQPYIVALMSDLLDLPPSGDSKVLEIGTGSGYQTAVLAELAGRTYSIDIIPQLATEAARRLEDLGYRNVRIRTGDGYLGWPEEAPFDAILITAAVNEVPPPLLEQLKPGGRLVLPMGRPSASQDLTVVEKGLSGEVHLRSLLPVAFVPFRRAGDAVSDS
ncbi:MAG: protein-L-isoaspartate(D-aspartate) O-methyltransferase [Gammaproteobacteria bacterium]